LYVLCFVSAVLAFRFAEYISCTPGYEAICCLFFACSFSTVSDLSVALYKDVLACTRRSKDIAPNNLP
jgi:hypothetical protein